MKEGQKKLSAKVVAAMLESIIVFLETVKDVEKTWEDVCIINSGMLPAY